MVDFQSMVAFGLNKKMAAELGIILNQPNRIGRILIVHDLAPTREKIEKLLRFHEIPFDVYSSKEPMILEFGEDILLMSSFHALHGVRLSAFSSGVYLEDGENPFRQIVKDKIKSEMNFRKIVKSLN